MSGNRKIFLITFCIFFIIWACVLLTVVIDYLFNNGAWYNNDYRISVAIVGASGVLIFIFNNVLLTIVEIITSHIDKHK